MDGSTPPPSPSPTGGSRADRSAAAAPAARHRLPAAPGAEELSAALALLDVGELLGDLAARAADRLGGDVDCVITYDCGDSVGASGATSRAAGSSVTLPLTVDRATVGFLTVHTAHAEAFVAAHPFAVATAVADTAGALAVLAVLTTPADLGEQLQTALAARAVVDQAVGVVIHDRRCSPDQALEFLRGVSHRRRAELDVVAAALVARAARPPDPQSHTVSPPR